MQWIGQKYTNDCGIAALAMFLGLEYDETESLFGDIHWRLQATRNIPDRNERLKAQKPLNDEYISKIIQTGAREGKTIRLLLNAEDCPEDQTVQSGNVYLASVRSDYVTGSHAVVISKDGAVFDPNKQHDRRPFSAYAIIRLLYVYPTQKSESET